MNYAFNITTPANTVEADALKTQLDLTRGVITKLDIRFPPGSSGNLALHIDRAIHQVWPANQGSYYVGDGDLISIPANYRLDQPPYHFEAFTWNDDTDHEHLVIIRFDIDPGFEEQLLTAEYLEESAEELEA